MLSPGVMSTGAFVYSETTDSEMRLQDPNHAHSAPIFSIVAHVNINIVVTHVQSTRTFDFPIRSEIQPDMKLPFGPARSRRSAFDSYCTANA